MAHVSIILCTCNRADSLRSTLESIGQIEVPFTLPTELLIVDNASTDKTFEVVRSASLANMPIRYVHEPRRGKGYAYNTGMAQAGGRIFLFTDDDVRVPAKWIERLCLPIWKGEVDAMQGGVQLPNRIRERCTTRLQLEWLASTEFLDHQTPGGLVGANMAISRSILLAVPGFDEELGPGALGFGDETLFAAQLQKAGFRIGADLRCQVIHEPVVGRLSRRAWIDRAWRQGCADAYIDYHWQHVSGLVPIRRLVKRRLRLFLARLRHMHDCIGNVVSEWELKMVRDIGYVAQLRRERRRPRKYMRHGLTVIRRAA